MEDTRRTTDGPRVFVYRGYLPPMLGVLLLAPLLVVFLSLAAAIVAGGTVAALVLPWLFRSRVVKPPSGDSIELRRDQYSHVNSEPRRLPPV